MRDRAKVAMITNRKSHTPFHIKRKSSTLMTSKVTDNQHGRLS